MAVPAEAVETRAESKAERRVLFVRNVPFDATDTQLEEACAALGPVRRCFLVRQKGAEKHRGFGYVHFALAEDAVRAVNAPDGISLKGRKLLLHIAGKRPAKEERIKARIIQDEAGAPRKDIDKDEAETGKEEVLSTTVSKVKNKTPKPDVPAVNKKRPRANSDALQGKQLKDSESQRKKKKERKDGEASPAQRSARTVVLGGLQGQAMKEAVLSVVREVVTCAESPHDFSADDVKQHGLARDGCSPEALVLVCNSVRDARKAVSELHGRKLEGKTLWARQLGGESSKLKKHRLIVRNLPYQVNETELRKVFSTAGFVWDLTLPRTPEGRLRGFAFVQYTSHADAQKAVTSLNGTQIGGRPVAVDWTVSKSEYVASATEKSGAAPVSGGDVRVGEGEEEGEEEEDEDLEEETKASEGTGDGEQNEPGGGGKGEVMDEVDEGKQMREVLARVLADAKVESGDSKKRKKSLSDQPPVDDEQEDVENGDTKGKPKRVKEGKDKVEPSKDECCTVFVRGLPSTSQESDVRELFSKFGNLRSCRLVLHPVTKRPRGTAFIDFANSKAAEAAVKAAEKGKPLAVQGRKITVNLAVGREEAKQIAVQKAAKAGKEQKRNLHLLQEGIIMEGSSAARGMSEGDRRKRSRLQEEKATKLQSPRFAVSDLRLAVHNVPTGMMSAELRKLFLEAVRQRATKQNPTISEVKMLVDKTKKIKGSPAPLRGVAFVEFTDPQHALVALRALNNRPDVFTTDRRPIVEFAIVDHGALKKREQFKANRVKGAKESKVVKDSPAKTNSESPDVKRGNHSPWNKKKRQRSE